MSKKSAGILAYRFRNKLIEVFLVHPGGPFWSKKDTEAWSIPKGEFTDDEDPLHAAKREFREETGMEISGTFHPLASLKQNSGKIVFASRTFCNWLKRRQGSVPNLLFVMERAMQQVMAE